MFHSLSRCIVIRMGVAWLLPALIIAGCSSTDCPLNNTVYLSARFYNSSSGAVTNITDTLSVIAGGKNNTLILNRFVNFNQINLPMGYVQTSDTLLFCFKTKAGTVVDQVVVENTNVPHFVSLDCSTAFFHTITGVSVSPRVPTADFPTAIDSIVILQPEVNYDERENLQIYFSTY